MNENSKTEKAIKFLVGKGFYIVLFLCFCAIGISGYVILFSNNSTIDPEIEGIPSVGLATTVDFSLPVIETAASSEEQAVAKQTGIPAKTTAAPKTTAASTSETLAPPEQTQPPQSSEVVGTAEKIFYSAPVLGEVSNLFSGDVPVFNPTMGDWRVHAGVDILAPVGTEVKAVCKGVVSKVYKDEFKGVCVEIDHADGLRSVYCGMEDVLLISKGDEVLCGTVLGTVGTSAAFESNEGPHLHVEIRDGNGLALDPLEYFNQSEN